MTEFRKVFPQYTNLYVHVAFADDKVEEIIKDIEAVLNKHGFSSFKRVSEPVDSHQEENITFYPKECV